MKEVKIKIPLTNNQTVDFQYTVIPRACHRLVSNSQPPSAKQRCLIKLDWVSVAQKAEKQDHIMCLWNKDSLHLLQQSG